MKQVQLASSGRGLNNETHAACIGKVGPVGGVG